MVVPPPLSTRARGDGLKEGENGQRKTTGRKLHQTSADKRTMPLPEDRSTIALVEDAYITVFFHPSVARRWHPMLHM
jgi:hypothetical protein